MSTHSFLKTFQGCGDLLLNLDDTESIQAYLQTVVDVDLLEDTPEKPSEASQLKDSVDPQNQAPFAPRTRDLARLHSLVRSRRVTCVLEFGCGWSSAVVADALSKNFHEFGLLTHLRKSDPFRLHVVDEDSKWISIAQSRMSRSSLTHCNFLQSNVQMTTFQGQICTEYVRLPNCCPDLIYLDGPSQFAPTNEVNGISTNDPERVPMSCDILRIEPFLLPGCLILVDGRTSNARFLKNNLKRTWTYSHDVDGDVHYFELSEGPLGSLNAQQLDFSLGEHFFIRVAETLETIYSSDGHLNTRQCHERS